MNRRPNRVGHLIRNELAMIIERELEFPGSLVTVTDVDVSGKLDIAHVLVSILPHAKEAWALSELQNARGRLQHLLMKKLNIKPMPKILFEIDRGPENAAAVEKTLLGK